MEKRKKKTSLQFGCELNYTYHYRTEYLEDHQPDEVRVTNAKGKGSSVYQVNRIRALFLPIQLGGMYFAIRSKNFTQNPMCPLLMIEPYEENFEVLIITFK